MRLAKFFASPTTGVGNMGDTIQGEWVPWARHLIWGNYRITGGIILPGSNAWSTGVRWGSLETSTGARVVWGARFDDNIVWSTASDDNIVWSTAADDNIVWSTLRRRQHRLEHWQRRQHRLEHRRRRQHRLEHGRRRQHRVEHGPRRHDNIVWSTADEDNIVWSTGTLRTWCGATTAAGGTAESRVGLARMTASSWARRPPTTTSSGAPPTTTTSCGALPALPTTTSCGAPASDDNIVWSTGGDDNIVWSTGRDDNIVWSTSDGTEEVLWAELIEPVNASITAAD